MTNAIEDREGSGRRGRLHGPAVRILPVLLVSLSVAFLLWRDDLSATSGLFQSPQTPAPEPPTATVTEGIATSTPTLEPTFVPTTTATTEPALPPPATITPTMEATAIVTPAATAIATEPPPATATAAPEPTAPAREQEGAESGSQVRYPDESANLRFRWDQLFDSLALGLSYGWLCCGVLLLICLPVVFLALWRAGKRGSPGDE